MCQMFALFDAQSSHHHRNSSAHVRWLLCVQGAAEDASRAHVLDPLVRVQHIDSCSALHSQCSIHTALHSYCAPFTLHRSVRYWWWLGVGPFIVWLVMMVTVLAHVFFFVLVFVFARPGFGYLVARRVSTKETEESERPEKRDMIGSGCGICLSVAATQASVCRATLICVMQGRVGWSIGRVEWSIGRVEWSIGWWWLCC